MLDKTPNRSKLGPIELEVIHGTIRAAELEIEAAVERTARSPMIRDQHDYRVALFDAKGRFVNPLNLKQEPEAAAAPIRQLLNPS